MKHTIPFSVKAFQKALLTWFQNSGRKSLPWQKNPTSYRIWVSEIMLQQTQVTTVIPYYLRFMERFPDILSLAQSSIDEVLHYWTGLGYYARARHLHRSAQMVCKEYHGIFPSNFETLLKLPGIGRSTAGAILAFATQQSFPILDGNVKRVLSRVFAYSHSHPKTMENHLWSLATILTPEKQVGHYTQAIMDLGATLCTRSQPNCANCPVKTFCAARKQNKVDLFPIKRKSLKKPVQAIRWLLLVSPTPAVLLIKRNTRLWEGLWGPLESTLTDDVKQCCQKYFCSIKKTRTLTPFRHTFTHFHLDIHPVVVHITASQKCLLPDDTQWYPLIGDTPSIGMATPMKRLLHLLQTDYNPLNL